MKALLAIFLIAFSAQITNATESLKCITLTGKSLQLAFAIATGAPDDDEKIASFLIDGQNAIEQISKYKLTKGTKSLTLRNGTRFNITGQKVTQMNSMGQFQPLSCSITDITTDL